MVSSLKKSHDDPLELWANSKDFLHVFTDAVNHIPRHRRTKFFTHLVSVLGTGDFLAPVCMLLVEKVANRVVRQSAQDVQSLLELPVALMNNAPLPTRIQALVAILDEAQRLVTRMVSPEKDVSLFLSPTTDADANTALPYKRRAQALITFVGSTFTSPLSKAATQAAQPDQVVKGLVALATLDLPEPHLDVIKASLNALNRLLNVLSALDFIHAVASMMTIEDERVSPLRINLFLLIDRLPFRSKLVHSTYSASGCQMSLLLLDKTLRRALSASSAVSRKSSPRSSQKLLSLLLPSALYRPSQRLWNRRSKVLSQSSFPCSFLSLTVVNTSQRHGRRCFLWRSNLVLVLSPTSERWCSTVSGCSSRSLLARMSSTLRFKRCLAPSLRSGRCPRYWLSSCCTSTDPLLRQCLLW